MRHAAALLIGCILIVLTGCSASYRDAYESPSPTPARSTADDTPSPTPARTSNYVWTVVPVSEQCVASVDQAATHLDQDSPLVATVYLCTTVDEWVTAVRRVPLAAGLTDANKVDPVFDLAGVCPQNRASPVCQDAVARGLDVYWHQ